MITLDDKQLLLKTLEEYKGLGIANQIDYDKFYLYSIITHSTAIEGSTVTEIENQLLFDEGISAKGRSIQEQMMNLDLKAAYEQTLRWARERKSIQVDMLKSLSALVMKNTGSTYSTLNGSFDSSKGDLRLVNVTAGVGGRSYMNFVKVPTRLENFCNEMNSRQQSLTENDVFEEYLLSFDAHYLLVTIHPWVDGNGRMSRLLMNYLQFEYGLIPVKVRKDDKAEYIQALVDSRDQDSLEPFREFMLKMHIRNLQYEIAQYKQSMEDDVICGGVNANDGGVNGGVKSINGGGSSEDILLDTIANNPGLNAPILAEVLGKSLRTIQRHLKTLTEQQKIEFRGAPKNGGYWTI